MECLKYGITVSDAEVEHRFRADLSSFGKLPLTEAEFVRSVLNRFKKSLVEWKEDVIRPKIMMEKLVKPMVKVTDQEVLDGYEARFGPKVECRMIVVQAGNSAALQDTFIKARQGREQFIAEAKKQFIPNLANDEGKVAAIHKHFGDKALEDWAFRLKVNEVSDPIKMPDGMHVILMCDRHLPKDVNARFDNEQRLRIHKEIEDMKVSLKIPEVFKKLHDQANPRLVLQNAIHHMARSEQPDRGGLSAFDQVPNSTPVVPTNLPAPTPTNVLPPEGHGVVPTVPQSNPLPPITGVSPFKLPAMQPPVESKN